MHLHQIRYVAELAKWGSFSQAARELYITQPTLSQQVMALEEELGVKLFVRQPRRATLTDAGEEFVRYARRILGETETLAQAMHSYAAKARGRVRIGALWVFGYMGIAEHINRFRREYPSIDAPITINGSVVLLQKLLNRELDAVYVIATDRELARTEVRFHKILESNMAVVVPVENPLARRESLTYGDLDGQNVIMPGRDSSLYLPVAANFQACGAEPNVVCESSQTDVIIQCTGSNMGIAFLSEANARAMANERVVIRPITPTLKRTVYFAVLESTLVIPAVQSLMDYVARDFPLR